MLLKKYFSPDDFVEKYEFIDVEYMNMHNKKVIISDLDNTLISWDSKKDTKELNRWLKKMKRAGFDIIVVSNNSEERVEEFCKQLNLQYVADVLKCSSRKTLWRTFDSCNNYKIPQPIPKVDTQMHYWYADGEEKERKLDIAYMNQHFPQTEFKVLPKLGHAGLVLLKPDLFVTMINELF